MGRSKWGGGGMRREYGKGSGAIMSRGRKGKRRKIRRYSCTSILISYNFLFCFDVSL